MRHKKKLIALAVFMAAVFVNNSAALFRSPQASPLILAHRGLAQTFHMEGITGDTDTSKRIHPPEHSFLENTIASMREAFRLGADMAELDVQMTKDSKFAVFHDHTLAYRTDGTGRVRERAMEELKKLDIGHGYTADGGKTFPFRGKGTGRMPELEEVLAAFTSEALLIHIKSNDPAEGELMAKFLSTLPLARAASLRFYGGDGPMRSLKDRFPAASVMSRETLMKALMEYVAIGWTGYVPSSCRGAWLHIPAAYAGYLWGWPDVFMARMKKHGTTVVLVMGSGKFSEGFDTAEEIKNIPGCFSGYVWTNRIDRIAPALGRKPR